MDWEAWTIWHNIQLEMEAEENRKIEEEIQEMEYYAQFDT